ncbi:23S rRNA (pseudouridine(1915)-N(3))-methyltransferase RlmH [Candidatus Gracilibacteria bacterium]|nr:23S rRNA (pseudouridine(1915)-N(3))-methyltransferase RlmH [Candidatus Gracilibacteria bacterium]
MIKIYIFADAMKHFNDAVKEYDKRLGRNCKIIKLKPVKKGTPAQIIEAETKILKEKIEKENAYKVILAPGGESLNTFAFHKLIEDNKQIYPHIIFCIGGAYGLNYDALKLITNKFLTLSGFILPHALALTILLEQVYRAMMIEKGSDYHK